jgi:hypothetical protein
MQCYSNTFHFSFNARGIIRSSPFNVGCPFHVNTPRARPCNPFGVTYSQNSYNNELLSASSPSRYNNSL